MARYVKDIVLNKPEDFVNFIMQDYLRKNQFVMSEWKGEPAWRAGDGVVEGFKYLKWSYFNGMFHLEAWLKGTTGGEMGLDGVVGVLMKKPYRESLEQLFTVLQQELQVPPQGQHRQEEQQPRPTGVQDQGQQSQPIYVQTTDNTKAATGSLIFGVLSVVLCIIPIAAIILGVLAVSRARMGMGASQPGKAKAGRILGIVGICLGIILWVLNLLLIF